MQAIASVVLAPPYPIPPHMMTNVKDDPTKNRIGFLSMLPINGGCPAMQDTRSSPLGTVVLFGTVLVLGTFNILATHACFVAATISTTEGPPRALSEATIGNQEATCWAAISSITNSVFLTNVGMIHIVEVDPANGKIMQSTALPNAKPGAIDLVAAGTMVYAQSLGNRRTTKAAVVVIQICQSTARPVQSFEPKKAGSSSQGLTLVV